MKKTYLFISFNILKEIYKGPFHRFFANVKLELT